MPLQDIYSANPMDIIVDQNNDQLKYQQGLANLTYTDLANQTTSAQMPGVQAQASILERKNRLEEALYADTLKAKQQANQPKPSDFADAMTAWSQVIHHLPVEARHAATRAFVKEHGLEGYYPPEMDKSDATKLDQTLQFIGRNIYAGAPKAVIEESKNDAKRDVAGINASARNYGADRSVDRARITADASVARARIATQAKSLVERAAKTNDPKTMEAAAAKYFQLYQETGDPKYKDAYEKARAAQAALEGFKAGAKQIGKPDIGATTQGQVPTIQAPPISSAVTNIGSQKDPGTITTKSGRTFKAIE